MSWVGRHSRLVVVLILAMHAAIACGVFSLTIWLYFEAGFKWTQDQVFPQVQAVLAFIGHACAAVFFVPIGILSVKRMSHGLVIAVAWPLVYAITPFLLPNVVAWLIAVTLMSLLSVVVLRQTP